jgi:periplasmic protein CpxP/Spy
MEHTMTVTLYETKGGIFDLAPEAMLCFPENTMRTHRLLLALSSLAACTALAQAPAGPPPGAPPPRPDIAKILNIDAARAAKVEAILDKSREQMRAVREETDRQLATVLSAAEIAKLKESMPRPPGPPPK